MARYIGKVDTVEEERRRSPKSKLGEKRRDQAVCKIVAVSGRKQPKKTIERQPPRSLLGNACGTRRRPSLSSAPQFSAVSTPRRPRAAAEVVERDPRKEPLRKLKRDTIPADPGPGAQSPVQTSRSPLRCQSLSRLRMV